MSARLTRLRVILARPRGFCAGVVRAIEIVERALAAYGPPVYVRHEIVHNRHVVERLRERGAIFVDDVQEIPEGALTVFSTHGVSRGVEDAARASEIGEAADIESHLIDGPVALDPDWLDGIEALGLTAGASAPESVVQETIRHLRSLRVLSAENLEGVEEKVQFRLPERIGDGERLAA
jgi:4-hydroxy-3-methylbut-2-enyl diphosphate reductase IspH